jgi:hypothetical protein
VAVFPGMDIPGERVSHIKFLINFFKPLKLAIQEHHKMRHGSTVRRTLAEALKETQM